MPGLSPRKRGIALACFVVVLMMITPQSKAQHYPEKTINFVVPFAAGSGTDQQARVYGKVIAEALKVPIVIDNKGGASGFIAAQYVAKAAPDGYTLLLTTNTTQVANPSLFKTLPYDPTRDFAPIALLSTGQLLLMVRPNARWRSAVPNGYRCNPTFLPCTKRGYRATT